MTTLSPFLPLPLRSTSRRKCAWLLALALLAGVGSSPLHAQDPELFHKWDKAFEAAMDQAFKRALGDTLHVSPAVALVDPATHTVTLALTNVGADPIAVDTLRLQDAAPPARRRTAADPLLAPDARAAGANPKDSSQTDSLRPVGSLAAWVQEVPKPFEVAPGATHTLSLHLAVPPSLAPGVYATYLVLYTTTQVWATPAICLLVCDIPVPVFNEEGRYPFAVTRIVYRVGAAPSKPAGGAHPGR